MWTFPFQNHPNGWLICWWGRPFVGLLFEPSVGYRPNYWAIIGRSRPPDDKIENCPATSGQCVCAACRHTIYLCLCICVFVLCISIICVCVLVHMCCGVYTPIGPLQSGFSNWPHFAYTCICVVCFNNSCLRTCAQCARVLCTPIGPLQSRFSNCWGQSLCICVVYLYLYLCCVCVHCARVHSVGPLQSGFSNWGQSLRPR